MTRVGLAGLLAVQIACAGEVPLGALLDAEMVTGHAVSSLLPRTGTAIVFLVDPAECFRCLGQVSEVVELRRDAGAVVRILLSRRPVQSEERQLALHRIETDGVLKRPHVRGRKPVFLLVRDARIADSMPLGHIDSVRAILKAGQAGPSSPAPGARPAI